MVAQIDELDAAMVADAVAPAREADARADVAVAERAAGVGAVTVHGLSGGSRRTIHALKAKSRRGATRRPTPTMTRQNPDDDARHAMMMLCVMPMMMRSGAAGAYASKETRLSPAEPLRKARFGVASRRVLARVPDRLPLPRIKSGVRCRRPGRCSERPSANSLPAFPGACSAKRNATRDPAQEFCREAAPHSFRGGLRREAFSPVGQAAHAAHLFQGANAGTVW